MSNSEPITAAGASGEILSPMDRDAGGNYTSSKLMSQEGVYQLTKDLRAFSEALTALKSVFLDDQNVVNRGLKVAAHERLGELLQVLRMVVDKYSELKSGDILTAAGELIKIVKEYNYEEETLEVSPEIFRAINNLAMVFSNSVSECLMGDTNISSHGVMSPLYDDFTMKSNANDSTENHSSISDSMQSEKTSSYLDQTDEMLYQADDGFDLAFDRSKILSKYLTELLNYVKKKANLETEHAKNLMKLSQQTKSILSEQSFLPFQSLYCTSLDHDREYANKCFAMYQNSLLQHKFVESLQAKKSELDKQRKYIRDLWLKDKKRLDEAVTSLKKAKQFYQTKVHDHQKAKEAAMKAEVDQQAVQPQQTVKLGSSGTGSAFSSVLLSASGASKIDKKKKQEEDTNAKAANAEYSYKVSVHEANKRRKELDKNKAKCLQQLRELMLSCDQTVKSVTISYFQLNQALFAPIPIQYQAMAEDAKLYDPGFQYTEYVRHIPMHTSHSRSTGYEFESCSADGSSYRVHGGNQHNYSSNRLSDTESSSSPSFDDLSPSTSPGDLLRRSGDRRHSTGGSLSSEEVLEEKEKPSGLQPPSQPFSVNDGIGESSPIPLRSITKKGLKVAANVRGAFKTKKLPKSMLFGVEISVASQGSPDGIPYLVKKCVAEIDSRALDTKGIYRVNGVKNRVEKLCAQFDSAPDRVELSPQSPHDVSGVLKYFFRQLPDPLLQFKHYNTFLDIAKDYQQLINSTNEAARDEQRPAPSPTTDVMNSYLSRVRDTVERLPIENRNTLQYVISHLTRIAMHSRDNKMTASNLAIVFGPTLLRPLTTDGNESLKMLIDLPYQSRFIEMLIIHKDFIFGTHSHQAGNIFPFSGFTQAPPGFSPEEKSVDLSSPASKVSIDSAPPVEKEEDTSITLDRDILLTFDDDHASSSTEHSTADSQYNTATDSKSQRHDVGCISPRSSAGNREILSNSASVTQQESSLSLTGSYSRDLLSLSSFDDTCQSTTRSTNPNVVNLQPLEGAVTPPVPRRTRKTSNLHQHRTPVTTKSGTLPRSRMTMQTSPLLLSHSSCDDVFHSKHRELTDNEQRKQSYDNLFRTKSTSEFRLVSPALRTNNSRANSFALLDLQESEGSGENKSSFC